VIEQNKQDLAEGEPMDGSMDSEGEDAPEIASVDWTVPLEKEGRDKLGRHLRHLIEQYISDTEPRRSNGAQWRNDHEMMPAGRGTRWKNSSKVPAILTHIYCENHRQKLNSQIVQISPPFTVIARRPEAQEAVPLIEDALLSSMDEAEWEEKADQLHNELPLMGNCFLRVDYTQRFRRCPKVKTPFEPDHFVALTRAGMSPVEAFLGAHQTDKKGRPKVQVMHDTVKVHDGVEMKVIKWEDGVILPSRIRDPDEAYGIGERLMIRGIDLKLGAKNGRYFQKEVDDLLTRSGDTMPSDRQEVLDAQGTVANPYETTQEDPEYRDYLCYELCWLMDGDGDGELEWVLVTLHYETGVILGLKYLPYEHGEPCFHLFRLYTRTRELWGIGIAEKIACIQDALMTVMNQIIDHGDLMLNMHGNLVVDDTAGVDVTKAACTLGTPIRVDDVNGVKPLVIPGLPPELYSMLDFLKSQGDLVSATNNNALGKTTDASKTLGEVQIALGQNQQISEEVAARVSRTWARVADQVRWLKAQYGEGGEVRYRKSARADNFMASGDNAFGVIDAEDLLQDVDLIPTGLGQLADLQSRIQVATQTMSTLAQMQLTATNTEVQSLTIDYWLHEIRCPKRQKIMQAIMKGLAAQQAVQGAELQAALAQPQLPPGAAPPAGAPPPAPQDMPEAQGPQGVPLGAPEGQAMGPGGMPMPPIPGGNQAVTSL
jgi:hypothetical protein